jgi:hypothetical protein
MTEPKPYGILAEFVGPTQLLAATKTAREAGYRRMEAYSPYPIKELDQFISGWDLLSTIVFASGVAGAFIGFYLQYFIAADLYPLDVSGKPLNSWQSYVVITFEMAVLFAVIATVLGTLFFEGFPALYHPLFRVSAFRRASSDGFFLCIEACDGKYHTIDTTHFLQSLDPLQVWQVDRE